LNAPVQLSYAAVGDAAKGVIMLEKKNEILELTTTPCADDAHKRRVIFKWPWSKTASNKISCESQTYDQYVVQQQ
jgi:hypothetical protein